MTVEELIEQLKRLPPQASLVFDDACEEPGSYEDVEVEFKRQRGSGDTHDMSNCELWWTTKPGPPRAHYGARRGEHPRYCIRHESRSGALTWVVYYRSGDLKDLELSACPDSRREAERVAVEDLAYRIAIGQVQSVVADHG